MQRYMMTAVTTMAALAVFAAPFKFSVVADRESCFYRCGETAEFTVRIADLKTDPTNRLVKIRLDDFGDKLVSERIVDTSKETEMKVSGTLANPGFLRILVSDPAIPAGGFWSRGKGNLCDSVGFDVEKIASSVQCPGDFDAYWEGEQARLAQTVPLDPRIEPIPELSKSGFEWFTVSFATFNGKRVYGFFAQPKAPGKYPLRFNVPGAGPSKMPRGQDAVKGSILVWMNVHPQPVPKSIVEAKKVYPGGSYPIQGMGESREAAYYHDIILGIDRAVSWFAERDNVDRTRFSYYGGSQGGGFGCYLMGLNCNFTRGFIYITALADLTGCLVGRQSGWPSVLGRVPPSQRKIAEKVAPYYDAVNFSRRIRCPLRVFAGLADTTCPPHAVTAAFNAVPVRDKEIIYGAATGHTLGAKAAKWKDWVLFAEGDGGSVRN